MRFKYVAKDFIRESLIYYILSDMSFYERYFYRESLFLTIGYLKIPVSTTDLSILTINGFHHMNTWIYKPLDPFTEPIERGKIVIDCRSLVMNQLKPYQHIEIMKKGEYETYYDYDIMITTINGFVFRERQMMCPGCAFKSRHKSLLT